MTVANLEQIIEALLMVADAPMSAKKLREIINLENEVNLSDIHEAIDNLQAHYAHRGIQLNETASGFRFQANTKFSQWLIHLCEERPPKYSRAVLETLAIIAYRQPITRAEIEAIRGVAVSTNIVKILLDRQWVKILGQRDVPGRPSIYGTTKLFLDYFNLKNLTDLPTLSEITDIENIELEKTPQQSQQFNPDEQKPEYHEKNQQQA